MRSGWINIPDGSLIDAGFNAYNWSDFSHSEIVFAYYLSMNNQSVYPLSYKNRYIAFPDNPMCGAGI